MGTRSALALMLLCAACGGPSVEDRIDALRARGTGFAHNQLPSPARMAELYPDATAESLKRKQDDLRGHADAAALLDAGPAAVPDLVRLLDDPERRKLAAGFLAEIGGESAATALLARWRRHRGAIGEKGIYTSWKAEETVTTYGTRYEPDDGRYFAEVIFGLCVTGRHVSAEVARDTATAMDEAERLHAAGEVLHRKERRDEGEHVVTQAEPVETAREGLHILGMSGAPEGPALFARALRSPVDAFRWRAVQEVPFLGRGQDQTLPVLGALLDDPRPELRSLVVSAVASLTDRAAVPMNPSPTELEALAARYEALLREKGHLRR